MKRLGPIAYLLLAGCAGPAIRTAAVAPLPAPATWRTDAGPTAPLDRAWWRSFGDPVMAQLVEQALDHNPDIAIAVGRVREVQANLTLARAQLLPTLDAGIAGGRSRSVSAFGMPQEQNFAQPQLQASYEIDLFGRLADQQSAARNAYFASEAARDATRLAVAAATASGYVTLRSIDARLGVARSTLAARTESLRIARSRFGQGYSPKLELEQSLAEYNATAQIIPQIELAITRTEDALSQLTGTTPQAIARGVALAQLTRPAIPAGLPADLLRRRPDVAQAEYQLAASDKNLAAARKRFLPQVRLTAAAGSAFSTLLADPIAIWSPARRDRVATRRRSGRSQGIRQ